MAHSSSFVRDIISKACLVFFVTSSCALKEMGCILDLRTALVFGKFPMSVILCVYTCTCTYMVMAATSIIFLTYFLYSDIVYLVLGTQRTCKSFFFLGTL